MLRIVVKKKMVKLRKFFFLLRKLLRKWSQLCAIGSRFVRNRQDHFSMIFFRGTKRHVYPPTSLSGGGGKLPPRPPSSTATAYQGCGDGVGAAAMCLEVESEPPGHLTQSRSPSRSGYLLAWTPELESKPDLPPKLLI